ncbi:MAG: holo-ACP synthase [Burkholderiaceae bacterium]|nr:holo-ACP synthase [Burkholderiaceae bacterium]
MIHGIGTDIVQVARIATKGDRLAEKVLGPDELLVYRERSAKVAERGARYLAARFAAKEAFSKALGTGFRPPMSWHGLQVLNDELGKPVAVFSGELQTYLEANQLQAHISLSDEADYVVAFVTLSK